MAEKANDKIEHAVLEIEDRIKAFPTSLSGTFQTTAHRTRQ